MKKIIPRESTKWAGGTTTELFLWPQGTEYAKRDFLWRVSTARVEQDHSVFTELPDYERILIPLTGDVELKHASDVPFLLKRFNAHRFDGAVQTQSRGRVGDFNVMLRKGLCQGNARVIAVKNEQSHLPSPPENTGFPIWQRLLYCFEGSASVCQGEACCKLSTGEPVLLEDPSLELELTLQSENGAGIVLVDLYAKPMEHHGAQPAI